MGIRNKRPDLNGVIVVDKPLHWSSARVCGYIRRITSGAKVGHAGTLDPLATGVLVCCLGKATKSIPNLMDTDKAYVADIDLSAFSTTDDAEGERTNIDVESPPTRDAIESTLADFIGTIMQRPPVFSAVHVDGKRAYKRARAGETPDIPPRPVTIHDIRIEAYDWPALRLAIDCGKGTYIRSIARDLGAALGTGGMLTGLVRTRVGPYALENARSIESFEGGVTSDDLIDPPM